MKPIEKQKLYKKVVGFTLQQKKSLEILKSYDVNINNFIRIAVREKLQREWKSIKEKKDKHSCPF